MPAKIGQGVWLATDAKPQSVTTTAETIKPRPPEARCAYEYESQLEQRAGIAGSESHFRKYPIVRSLQEGHEYIWRLTFDMRGARKAQPFGHPLDGRVRAHSRPGDTWRT
jgi:hypothetical protein